MGTPNVLPVPAGYHLRLISIAAFDGGFFSLLGPDGMLQWRAIAKDGADLVLAGSFLLLTVYRSINVVPIESRCSQPTTLLQGTLDLLILKSLVAGEKDWLGISRRIRQISGGTFEVKPGSLFTALHRMVTAASLA